MFTRIRMILSASRKSQEQLTTIRHPSRQPFQLAIGHAPSIFWNAPFGNSGV
jgi:hypothetical protein